MKKRVIEGERWVGILEEEILGDDVIYVARWAMKDSLGLVTGPTEESVMDHIEECIDEARYDESASYEFYEEYLVDYAPITLEDLNNTTLPEYNYTSS